MKKLSVLVLAVLFVLIFSSSSGRKKGIFRSSITKDYVEIPSGNVIVDSTGIELGSFYISKYEISNESYLEFVHDLNEGADIEAYSIAQVKEENWEKLNVLTELGQKYSSHPGFKTFPVVNVTHEAAMLYCQWLTEKVRNEVGSDYTAEFRLPTRAEWIRAARGASKQVYAWRAPYLNDEQGNYLCNFKKLGVEAIHFNRDENNYEIVQLYDGQDLTITTKPGSYKANEYGLYDMCGNVSEMISDAGIAVGGSYESPGYDVRVESVEQYEGSSPCVGFRPVMIVKKK